MWTVLSFVILLCYAVFLLYPMLNLLRQSVVTTDGAFTLEYFQKFFGKSYYLITLWNSFKVSIAVTIITLIIGVPLAYLYNMYERSRARAFCRSSSSCAACPPPSSVPIPGF